MDRPTREEDTVQEMQQFLEPTESIEAKHPRIIELSEGIVSGISAVPDRASRLFEHVRDEIGYTVHSQFHDISHYRATATINRGWGFCVQKSIVLVSLCRAAGIPARLVFADIINHRIPDALVEMMGSNLFVHHCYTELHIDGRWLQATPSFDRGLCEKHQYPLVEFDGSQHAILPALDTAGRPFVEYVAHHGSFADLDLEPMLAHWVEAYGDERVARWRAASEAGDGLESGIN